MIIQIFSGNFLYHNNVGFFIYNKSFLDYVLKEYWIPIYLILSVPSLPHSAISIKCLKIAIVPLRVFSIAGDKGNIPSNEA